MYIFAAYLAYLAVTIPATVWTGVVLRRTGRVFLIEAFHGDASLADSVNSLLIAGFYLVTLAFVALGVHSSEDVQNLRQSIDLVCDKIGSVLLGLALMHFFNLYLLERLRRRGRDRDRDRERPERRRSEPLHLGRVLD